MPPPEALLSGSTRLSLDAFRAEFAAAWSRLGTRFLKVECWQDYQELEAAASQDAYNRGDAALARELLRSEAESDQSLYEDVRHRGIDYARLRLVKLPLTPYLEYEMVAYSIRAEMGERIEVMRIPGGVRLPSADYFDFLLFDAAVALIHDYGSGAVGVQSGGWLVRDPWAISTLEGVALDIRAHAVPVGDFLAAWKA
jgi:hypothetical protein